MSPLEPTYTFTIPSLHDRIVLDCRLYLPYASPIPSPHTFTLGAVLAHPYAPLGGSYDDAVLLALVPTLLARGYAVTTFNFRGAGGSAGRTSWTGRPEQDDYLSVLGFLIYFLWWTGHDDDSPSLVEAVRPRPSLRVICGGYSYGALVLARLPPLEESIADLSKAGVDSAGAEIILRARKLATDAQQVIMDKFAAINQSSDPSPATNSISRTSHRVSSTVIGGEETPKSLSRSASLGKRSSREFIRRSLDSPRRIISHARHRSDGMVTAQPRWAEETATPWPSVADDAQPRVIATYLFVSPVLVPLTTMLLPPGPSISFNYHKSKAADDAASEAFLRRPTLALFGAADTFTSGPKLRAWAQKCGERATHFEWEQIENAGHFWHEPGVLTMLQRRVNSWVKASHLDA